MLRSQVHDQKGEKGDLHFKVSRSYYQRIIQRDAPKLIRYTKGLSKYVVSRSDASREVSMIVRR